MLVRVLAAGSITAAVVTLNFGRGTFGKNITFRHGNAVSDVAASNPYNSLCAPVQRYREREQQREPCEPWH
jgi:hypothetical protein